LPAQLYCTGPAHVFVSVYKSTLPAIAYLGTCEDAPRIKIVRKWREIHNDIGGDEAFDRSYMGRAALISLDLNRFDEDVMQRIEAMPNAIVGRDGAELFGDIGTIVGLEAASLGIYVQFPYSVKAAFQVAPSQMPAGYRFPRCVPLDDEMYPLGTKARKNNIAFVAQRIYNPTTGDFLLYDHNMTGLPAVS
jgi:hypothetical protein